MTDTVGGSGPEPDPEFEAQFARLMQEMEQGRKAPFEEPSARARMLAAKWREQPPPTTPWRGDLPSVGDATVPPRPPRRNRRPWLRGLAILVIIGSIAGAIAVTSLKHDQADAANTTSNTSADTAATGTATDPSDGGLSAAGGGVAQIPLARLFPKTVPGAGGMALTLVTATPLGTCTDSDMVGTRLAALFAQSAGCVGGESALYTDAGKDQFNVTVFTLEDPSDVVSIMTALASDPTDFEVGVLAPPAGSGLAALPADAPGAQQFGSYGNCLGVYTAQWADGRSTGIDQLQTRLTPLQKAVSANLMTAGGQ